MSESNNLFWLKLLVFGMGIVLTLGGGAMIFFTYHQVFVNVPAAQERIVASQPVACKDSTVDLTKRGKIITSSVGSDRLTRVVIEKTSGEYEVVSVDGCTGLITHTLTLPVTPTNKPAPDAPTSPSVQ